MRATHLSRGFRARLQLSDVLRTKHGGLAVAFNGSRLMTLRPIDIRMLLATPRRFTCPVRGREILRGGRHEVHPRGQFSTLAASASGRAAARSAAARLSPVSSSCHALAGACPRRWPSTRAKRGAQATEAEEAHAHCQPFAARAKRAPPATWPCAARGFTARGPSTLARAGARALRKRATQGP